MIDYGRYLAVAVEATGIAAELIRTRSPGMVTAKGDRDAASDVDYAVERVLRTFLTDRTPEVGFLGEEEGASGTRGGLIWAADPVDGTMNFLHDLPLCAVSLGLVEDDRPVVGAVRMPFLGLAYSAAHGRGAHSGARRLHVSPTAELRDAIVAIGDYAVGHDAVRKNRMRLAMSERLAARAQRVRMFGSAAVDLCWVAEGRLDASMMLSNKPWDTAAGVVIAREAGARVLDADGTDHTVRSSATIATNAYLADQVLEVVRAARAVGAPA